MLVRTLGVVDGASLWLARLAALLMAAIAVLMLSEIGTRFFLQRSLGVTWELATYCMAAVISLGAADTLRTGGHVRVGILLETLPRPLSRAVDIVATLLGVVIAAFLLGAFADFVWTSYQRGTRSFQPTRSPLWIPQSLVLIGLAMLVLQLLVRLLRLAVLGQDMRSDEGRAP